MGSGRERVYTLDLNLFTQILKTKLYNTISCKLQLCLVLGLKFPVLFDLQQLTTSLSTPRASCCKL